MDIWVYCFWNRHIIKGSKTLIKDYPTKWGKIIINIGIFNVMIFLIIFYYNSIFDIHTEAQLQYRLWNICAQYDHVNILNVYPLPYIYIHTETQLQYRLWNIYAQYGHVNILNVYLLPYIYIHIYTHTYTHIITHLHIYIYIYE